MRSLAIVLIAAGFLALSGCGCFEKWTDPRFDDRPLSDDGGKNFYPRDPAERPDPEQPAWQRCFFGTRFISVGQRP
jgi:hypothetical protein